MEELLRPVEDFFRRTVHGLRCVRALADGYPSMIKDGAHGELAAGSACGNSAQLSTGCMPLVVRGRGRPLGATRRE